MADRAHPRRDTSRRRTIADIGSLTIGLAALAGCSAVPSAEVKSSGAIDDAALLNNVLGLEYETMAAYDAALAAGALGPADAAMAHAFQADHEKHAEILVRAIARLHGEPVAARPPTEYRSSSAALTEREERLRFLVGFQQGLTPPR